MNSIIIRVLLILFYLFGISSISFSTSISIVINNKIITTESIDKLTSLLLIDAGLEVNNDNKNKFHTIAQNKYINTYIRTLIAQRSGIEISDNTLNKYMKNIAEKSNANLKSYYTFYNNVGIDTDFLKEKKRNDILWKIYINKIITQNIVYDKNKLLQYINSSINKKYRKFSIIIIPSGNNKSKSKNIILNIKKELMSGKSFFNIAKSFSTDISSINGGDIGWVKKREQPYNINRIIWSIPINDISHVLNIGKNFVILKVTDEKIETINNKEDIKKRYILNMINKKAIQKIESIRNTLTIEYK